MPHPARWGNWRGVAIALMGVLAISPDALLIRLVDLDPWTIMTIRGLFTAGALLLLVAVLAPRTGSSFTGAFRTAPKVGFVVAVTSAAANMLFVYSITATHVANTLVILSATPLIAAIIGHFAFRERIVGSTWAASAIALGAIALIFSQDLTLGVGNLAALVAAVFLSINLLFVRRYGPIRLLPPLALSGLLTALAAGWFADFGAVTASNLGWMAINGAVVIPIGVALQWTALRHITAPEVALISLLEIALGPLWVWLVLGDVPPTTSIAAGLVLMITLAAHTSTQVLRRKVAPVQ